MENKAVLITGGSGYVGKLMLPVLVANGYRCISVDTRDDVPPRHPQVKFCVANACDVRQLEKAIAGEKIDFILHLATQLDFAVESQKSLYHNNVESTRAIAQLAIQYQIPKIIFVSSSVAYLGNFPGRSIREEDVPVPVDEYGRSKVDSEKLLLDCGQHFQSIIIRCPAVIDATRLGMFSIIFDFIREGKKCWVLGDGEVPYQAIYCGDLSAACLKAFHKEGPLVLNIGSDRIPTLRQMYQYVIDHAQTTARIASIPAVLALPLMKLTYKLGISPLGPTQFRMLTQGFEFDNSLIKRELNWMPTLNSSEMLLKAYEFYSKNYKQISNKDVSANAQIISKLGVLRIVKFLS